MFIAPSAYSLGGVQAWLDYIVKGLERSGYEVIVGLVSGRFHDVSSYLSVHPFSNVERISNPTGSAEGRIRGIARSVNNVAPDMVLSVNVADVYPAMERLGETPRRARSVMTLHGIQADFMQDVRRYRQALDGVICTNQLVKLMLQSVGLRRERIKYAPYGVDPGPQVEEQETRHDSALRIGYVGRFDQAQKRVLDIPQILRGLDKRNFPYAMRLAGDGPVREELRLALAAWVKGGKVSLLGPLSPREVERSIYEWADVLLVTSNWETGPLVIWEAMSYGIPVVTAAYVGSKAEGSLVDRHNCLMFPVGDHDAATAAITELRDRGLRSRLIDNGLDLHSRKYSKEASIAAWRQAIAELLGLAPLPRSNPMPVPRAGRLDRVLGVRLAESVRQLTGRSYEHRTPGSEWPHSHSTAPTDEAFLRQASRLESEHAG